MSRAITVVLIGCCLVSASRSAGEASTAPGDEETTSTVAPTTEPAEDEEATAAIATSAEAEIPKRIPVDLLDPNVVLARVARDTYGGWQGSWTRDQSQNGAFGSSDRNGGFDYSPGQGQGFRKPSLNQGVGKWDQGQEFGRPDQSQGYGNSYQSQRFGKPYERKPFGIDNYYRLIRTTSSEPPRRRNDVTRAPATRRPFRVYPVFPG